MRDVGLVIRDHHHGFIATGTEERTQQEDRRKTENLSEEIHGDKC